MRHFLENNPVFTKVSQYDFEAWKRDKVGVTGAGQFWSFCMNEWPIWHQAWTAPVKPSPCEKGLICANTSGGICMRTHNKFVCVIVYMFTELSWYFVNNSLYQVSALSLDGNAGLALNKEARKLSMRYVREQKTINEKKRALSILLNVSFPLWFSKACPTFKCKFISFKLKVRWRWDFVNKWSGSRSRTESRQYQRRNQKIRGIGDDELLLLIKKKNKIFNQAGRETWLC